MATHTVETLRRFFGCYLLKSHHPRARGRSYVGFTVDPRRRIRQHNGELVNGASKTKKYRPWEMVLVVYGFPTQTQALQFEWAWQHPERSLDVRDAVARLTAKQKSGVLGKMAVLMEMLNAEPWCYFPLNIQFLSSEWAAQRGRMRAPPPHVAVDVAPLEALPEAVEGQEDEVEAEVEGSDSGEADLGGEEEGRQQEPEASMASAAPTDSRLGSQLAQRLHEDGDDAAAARAAGAEGKVKASRRKAAEVACLLCGKAANRTWVPCACGCRTHVECLARHFLHSQGDPSGTDAYDGSSGMPSRGACPKCSTQLSWMQVLSSTQNAGWEKHKKTAGRRAATRRAAGAGKQTEWEGGEADAEQQGQQVLLPGSPAESVARPAAARQRRRPRTKKGTASAAAAAAGTGADAQAAEVAGAPASAAAPPPPPQLPKRPRGRPRKPRLDAVPATAEAAPADPSSPSSRSWQGGQRMPEGAGDLCGGFELGALEPAAHWDDSWEGPEPPTWSPSPGPSPVRGSQPASDSVALRKQPQQASCRQRSAWVIEVLSNSEDEVAVPAAAAESLFPAPSGDPGPRDADRGRLGQGWLSPPLQQPYAMPQPVESPAQRPPLHQEQAVDLTSPSPLPLLNRLRQQRLEDSPRNTPSPAPLRKHRRAAAEQHVVHQERIPDVIVLSDSD